MPSLGHFKAACSKLRNLRSKSIYPFDLLRTWLRPFCVLDATFDGGRARLEVFPNRFVFLLKACGPVGLKFVQVVARHAMIVMIHAPLLGVIATPSVARAGQCMVVSYASTPNAVPAAPGSYGEDVNEVVAQTELLQQSLSFHPLVDELDVLLPARIHQVFLALQVGQHQLSVEAPAAGAGNFCDLAHDLAVQPSQDVSVLVSPLDLLQDGQQAVENGRDRRKQLGLGRPDGDALPRCNRRGIKAVDVVRSPVETGNVPSLKPAVLRTRRGLADDFQRDDCVAVMMNHLRRGRGCFLGLRLSRGGCLR
mmetsp:Transcript_19324/g.37440  ORF Transcript_19324/g.37440 Transcript_19324/m.37440 type:complete len:308 (-) Transcript_19324:139-1062(-)